MCGELKKKGTKTKARHHCPIKSPLKNTEIYKQISHKFSLLTIFFADSVPQLNIVDLEKKNYLKILTEIIYEKL
jgi:hypothetical protein